MPFYEMSGDIHDRFLSRGDGVPLTAAKWPPPLRNPGPFAVSSWPHGRDLCSKSRIRHPFAAFGDTSPSPKIEFGSFLPAPKQLNRSIEGNLLPSRRIGGAR